MKVEDRFLSYVAFGTNSDEESETSPSTACQFELGRHIEKELTEIGLKNVKLDEHCYVYAELPASEGCEDEPVIGLIAHMDTSSAVPGDNIKPSVIHYEGGDIRQSDTECIRVSDFPFLENYIGQDLIITDGTTLLGADDKAGVSEIVTAAEYLIAHPEIKHGKIMIGFTPDEEVGRGTDFFDIEGFGCDFAYTVDGGTLGELEYENFNAANGRIKFHGVNIHPGSAKNKMKNAILIANEYISMLPPAETPAHTEGYEGFYHIGMIRGDETMTEIFMIIRDHDMEKFEARKKYAASVAAYLNEKYGEGTVESDIKDSYYNMKEKILPVFFVVERAQKAMREAGVEPITHPIRGGTDGARLSFEGLPCPNLSTGGENFHGVHEFASIQAMNKMVEVIVNIVKK